MAFLKILLMILDTQNADCVKEAGWDAIQRCSPTP